MSLETKVYFEDGRTIVVFDNPSEELNEAIKKAVQATPAQQIFSAAGLFTTEKEDIAPEIKKKPDVESGVVAACKQLAKNSEQQREMGIDKVILTFATALNVPLEACENWLSKHSDTDKVARYNQMKKQILAL